MFITFEGIEGSGKSTQIARLEAFLQQRGVEVLRTREPGGSELGVTLRRILLDVSSKSLTSRAELFLLLADRAQHVAEVIRPALERGAVVICDRYVDSTTVYQGYGRGLDPKRLHELNDMAIGGLFPDKTFVLDLPPEVGLRRAFTRNFETGKSKSEGRFEAESMDFHTRIREGYLTLAAFHQERFTVVDAARDPDSVFEDIQKAMSALLEK